MKLEEDFIKIEQIDRYLLDTFLSRYQKHCQYLKAAQFQYPAFEVGKGWSVEGEFQIPDSWYIDNRGHLNPVEFNICYHQIYYVTFAYLIEKNLLNSMLDWDLETYKHRQLSHFLVVKFSSTFKKLINSKKFYGTLKINKCSTLDNLIMMQTSCAFYDSYRGWAEGNVTIAILNNQPPKTLKPIKEYYSEV